MDMPDTLDIQQVSAMLFADKETVLALARCGALPGTKIGKSWVFLRSDVLDFLRNRIQVDTQLRRRQVGNLSLPAAVALPHQHSRRRTKLPELPALPNAPKVSESTATEGHTQFAVTAAPPRVITGVSGDEKRKPKNL